MNTSSVLAQTRAYVHSHFTGEGTGHDWHHIDRVTKIAHFIQTHEGGDATIIELSALLHDIADHKFHDDVKAGGKKSREILASYGADERTIASVAYIVDNISFKGGTNKHKLSTIEGQIVQDADRLDALGAIGIARTFAYGGSKGRVLYDPDEKPHMYTTLDEYKKANSSSVNHFYEKLLLLKDTMNTHTAKRLAERRHTYMEKFLEEFYNEWNVELKSYDFS